MSWSDMTGNLFHAYLLLLGWFVFRSSHNCHNTVVHHCITDWLQHVIAFPAVMWITSHRCSNNILLIIDIMACTIFIYIMCKCIIYEKSFNQVWSVVYLRALKGRYVHVKSDVWVPGKMVWQTHCNRLKAVSNVIGRHTGRIQDRTKLDTFNGKWLQFAVLRSLNSHDLQLCMQSLFSLFMNSTPLSLGLHLSYTSVWRPENSLLVYCMLKIGQNVHASGLLCITLKDNAAPSTCKKCLLIKTRHGTLTRDTALVRGVPQEHGKCQQTNVCLMSRRWRSLMRQQPTHSNVTTHHASEQTDEITKLHLFLR